MNLDLSLILSLIGCITGCSGLLINFHKFLTEQFKLKIYFSSHENIFFDKINGSKCLTNYQGLVRINFVNKSSSPITIYDIDTRINNTHLVNREYDKSEITLIKEVFTDSNFSSLVFPMDKQIIFPLRIQPYDSFEGCLFFPFFPDTSAKYETVIFTFKTTKRIIVKNQKLLKFETKVHDNYDNDYI